MNHSSIPDGCFGFGLSKTSSSSRVPLSGWRLCLPHDVCSLASMTASLCALWVSTSSMFGRNYPAFDYANDSNRPLCATPPAFDHPNDNHRPLCVTHPGFDRSNDRHRPLCATPPGFDRSDNKHRPLCATHLAFDRSSDRHRPLCATPV